MSLFRCSTVQTPVIEPSDLFFGNTFWFLFCVLDINFQINHRIQESSQSNVNKWWWQVYNQIFNIQMSNFLRRKQSEIAYVLGPRGSKERLRLRRSSHLKRHYDFEMLPFPDSKNKTFNVFVSSFKRVAEIKYNSTLNFNHQTVTFDSQINNWFSS